VQLQCLPCSHSQGQRKAAWLEWEEIFGGDFFLKWLAELQEGYRGQKYTKPVKEKSSYGAVTPQTVTYSEAFDNESR
jgi:hypothetical protein